MLQVLAGQENTISHLINCSYDNTDNLAKSRHFLLRECLILNNFDYVSVCVYFSNSKQIDLGNISTEPVWKNIYANEKLSYKNYPDLLSCSKCLPSINIRY